MEDRKRAIAGDLDDAGPPSKRQATSANGAMRMGDLDKEKDVEDFQKGAIFRQMQEYKREKNTLESHVKDLTRRANYHDDHIRLIDAWFSQLLEEISILINGVPTTSNLETFESSLLIEKTPAFEEHLGKRSARIKTLVQDIYSRIPQTSPEVRELQERMSGLLAAEKAHIAELQKANDEKEQLSERLENASYRYLVAEKKLDRAKSNTVKKLEQQAIQKREDDSAKTKDGKAVKTEKSEVNGEVNTTAAAAIEAARKEAEAASDRQRVHIEQLEAENKKLSGDLSIVKAKAAAATDDDYANTGLFKTSRSQMEDLIKRVNDLKATNTQLRQEAQKLQIERTSYRSQLDDESSKIIMENESSLARTESDLARIRAVRDELAAELDILKKGQASSAPDASFTKEHITASEERIKSLEAEVARLQTRVGEKPVEDGGASLEDVNPDELRSRLRKVEAEHNLLISSEIPALQAAYSKFSALAKKLSDTSTWQDEARRLNAEKAKAEQKYFAAMKVKDAREAEVRALKAQNGKTSEIVSQLKEAEQGSRMLAAGLEKQVAEAKVDLGRLQVQIRTLEQKNREAEEKSGDAQRDAGKLKDLVIAKDKERTDAESVRRKAETELAQVKARLDDAKREVETLKKRGAKGDAAEADDWRRVAICPVCNINMRNTTLKLCGHCFCNSCIQDLISNRSRKCPSCGKAFGNNDSMGIVLA